MSRHPLPQTSCFILILFSCLLKDASSISWTDSDLRFYDNLRFSDAEDREVETRENSSVMRLLAPALSSTKTMFAQDDIKNAESEESVRLCHLVSMLPFSARKNGLSHGVPCGAAMTLAMLHFNQRNDEIVPELSSDKRLQNCNMKLTMEFFDTMHNPLVASRNLIDDVLTRNPTLSSPLPCALMGAERSPVSSQIAMVASMFGLPTISPISSSPELDNKDNFSLFGRTVPSASGVAMAALHFLKEVHGVTHCGVLYVNDNWGRAINRVVTRTARSLNDQRVVVVSASFDSGASEESVHRAFHQLLSSRFNYFIAVVPPRDHDLIVKVGGKHGLISPGRYWLFLATSTQIFQDGFSFNSKSQLELAQASNGLAFIDSDIPRNRAFSHAWNSIESNEKLKDYVISKQPRSVDLDDHLFRASLAGWNNYCYDSVMAVGIAACRTGREFFEGESLYQSFKGVNFTGASGNVRFDPQTGSRDLSLTGYKVTHVLVRQPDDTGKMSLDHQVVARQQKDNLRMVWRTATATFADGSSRPPPVLPPPQVDFHLIPHYVRFLCISLAGVMMLSSLFWITWTWRNRKSTVVQWSQPDLLMLLCCGTFMMSTTVIPLSLQDNVSSERTLNHTCMIAPWLFEVGFLVSISALASKMAVINQLMEHPRGFRRTKLNTSRAVRPFLVIGTAGVVLLVLWTALAPLHWSRTYFSPDEYGRNLEACGHCFGHSGRKFLTVTGALNVILLVWATMVSYRSRNLSCQHSESKYILLSVASVLQAFLLGVPVLVLLSMHPTAVFVTISLLMAWLCASILFPMFVPKEIVRRHYSRQQLNSDKRCDKESTLNTKRRNWTTIKQEVQCSKGCAAIEVWESEIYQQTGIVMNESDEISSIPWRPALDDLAL